MYRPLIAIALAVATSLGHAAATPPATASADASVEFAKGLRRQAQQLAGPEAPPDDVRRAVALYQQALDYVAGAAVRERADGNRSLIYEQLNLELSQAMAYAKLGQQQQALAVLARLANLAWAPAIERALAHEDFNALHDEPRFKALQATMKLPGQIYNTPAIATPWEPVLTTAEKVAGLSLFWAEARRNFVYFDHVPQLQWDQVYMDYLAKVIAAPTTEDYYRVMLTLAPLLQDAHTDIRAPEQLASVLYAPAPLNTALIEDKVIVLHVGDARVAARIHRGDEVVSIDGVPVRQYGRERIAPTIGGNTQRYRDARTFNYQLFAGDAGRPVVIGLRAPDGAERTETVARSGFGSVPPGGGFKMLDGGIAYIALDQFADDGDMKAFEAALPQILAAQGLIIDVRRNGGGNGAYAVQVLSHLTRSPIKFMDSMTRNDNVIERAQGNPMIDWSRRSYESRQPQQQVFDGRVAVLTGVDTLSAAEDFTAMFRIMKRGIVVGETTGGSTGQPLSLSLPGGGWARICVKRDVYPDGSTFVGKGIAPDLEAPQTVADLRAGRDLALERAAAVLRHPSARGGEVASPPLR
ncbi:S41 family peptidase [Duganella phyllosphaerae]|uniref:Peptidase family S41 n=1 Tax=Duganella phyllosphaerae TaxID=762836 RepID=A0A1E7WGU8_9BURK|nr:S41 family peptidase [Duganella phyllosphaerae]OEZ97794.1 peptidase family S41 [Duganella phyllosphaerae]